MTDVRNFFRLLPDKSISRLLALTVLAMATAAPALAKDAVTCTRQAESSLRYRLCMDRGGDCSGDFNTAYKACMTAEEKVAAVDPKCEAIAKDVKKRCEMEWGVPDCDGRARSALAKCSAEPTAPRDTGLRDRLRERLRTAGSPRPKSMFFHLNMCCESQCFTIVEDGDAGLMCGRMKRGDMEVEGTRWKNIRDASISSVESCPTPVLDEFFKKDTRGAGPSFVCKPAVASAPPPEPTPDVPETGCYGGVEKVMGVCRFELAGSETDAAIARLIARLDDVPAPVSEWRCLSEPDETGMMYDIGPAPCRVKAEAPKEEPKKEETAKKDGIEWRCLSEPDATGWRKDIGAAPCPKKEESDITGTEEDKAKRAMVTVPDPEPLRDEDKLTRPPFLGGVAIPSPRGAAPPPAAARPPVAARPAPSGGVPAPRDVPSGKSDKTDSTITGDTDKDKKAAKDPAPPKSDPKPEPAPKADPKPAPRVVSRPPDPAPYTPPPVARGPGGIKLDVRPEGHIDGTLNRNDVLKLLRPPGS